MKLLGLDLKMPRLLQKAATGVSLANLYPPGPGVWGWIREASAGDWQRDVVVDPLASLASFSAVFSCASRIAEDIAKLEPLLKTEVDMTAPGGSDTYSLCVNAVSTSPFWRTLRKPNHFQNRIQFFIHWILTKLLFGNAYIYKQRETLRGMVIALYVLDPRRTSPLVTPSGDVYYSLGLDELSQVTPGMVVPASEIIHDRAVTLWHPLIGVSPIYACALSATQGLKIQKNSAKFFGNMSRPGGLLTAPGTLKPEIAKKLKDEWEANYSGLNMGKTAVLTDGLKYEPLMMPPEQTQLVQQLGWTVEDVARAFAMPLYKINAGALPAAGNVEALQIQYYTDCLQIYIEALESCLTEGLELPATLSVEMDLDGLIRMDSKSQVETYGRAVTTAQNAPNEARAKRNLPPKAGGDAVYLQQQNFSLEALAKRDAKEDPFSSSSSSSSSGGDGGGDSSAGGGGAGDGSNAQDQQQQDQQDQQQAFDDAVTRASEVLSQQVESFLNRFLQDQEKKVSSLLEKAREDQIRDSARIEALTAQMLVAATASSPQEENSHEEEDVASLLLELGNEVATLFSESEE